MLAALGRFWRKSKAPQDGLPVEVVAAIEAARVTIRDLPDPETGFPRNLVQIAGGAPFYFDGREEAAARLGRQFDLDPAKAARAAGLLAFVVAKERREVARFQRDRTRKYSIWSW